MTDTIDLLQIKIEKAKRELPSETLNAINAVDWKASILELRAKKGYTFEQLSDLELETELLLCGLARAEDYPKELEKRMGISKSATNDLVNEMNNLVFRKIREELIKNTERKKIYAQNEQKNTSDSQILKSVGIEIVEKETLPVAEKLELTTAPVAGEKFKEIRKEVLEKIENPEPAHPILAQKLSASVQAPIVKTDHSLGNLSKTNTPNTTPKIDPYREIPE
ncbi:MAG: hypothetical protein WC735_03600 [Candidatus Paceibacterota bacterium]|jgi:hypothetical protein